MCQFVLQLRAGCDAFLKRIPECVINLLFNITFYIWARCMLCLLQMIEFARQ